MLQFAFLHKELNIKKGILYVFFFISYVLTSL